MESLEYEKLVGVKDGMTKPRLDQRSRCRGRHVVAQLREASSFSYA
jgi:hypothetical protein